MMVKCFVCKKEVSMGFWLKVNDSNLLFCNETCAKVFTKRLTSETKDLLEKRYKEGKVSRKSYEEQIKKYGQLK